MVRNHASTENTWGPGCQKPVVPRTIVVLAFAANAVAASASPTRAPDTARSASALSVRSFDCAESRADDPAGSSIRQWFTPPFARTESA